jgi:Lipase
MGISIPLQQVILPPQNQQGCLTISRFFFIKSNLKLPFFRIIIHGFGQNGRSIINRDLKNSYLYRDDFNVIIVDWSSVSSPYYQYARYRVGTTGIAVSKFIEFLNTNYETLHVIGFGLGGLLKMKKIMREF